MAYKSHLSWSQNNYFHVMFQFIYQEIVAIDE